MVRFDSAAPLDPGNTPAPAARRSARAKPAAASKAQNQAVERTFPAWARLADPSAAGADAGFEAAFRAGAGLALFDWILRPGDSGAEPAFAGAQRQRLALRAATASAWMARLREDERALRDAEHLSPNASGNAPTSPAGRIHRLWRGFAAPSVGFDEPSLRKAADLLELPRDLDLEALAGGLRRLFQGEKNPLAAAARAGSTTTRMLDGAPRLEAEILALWLSDLMLARKLGWDAPIALLATAITHPSLRCGAAGKRPRPGDLDWVDAAAGAYAMAAQEAFALAGELSRRSQALLAAQPKLRAKGAGRVVELLLGDDAVSPARAAKSARLSDRAARRLFDRLIELGAVRELSGRSNFRLYGL